MSVFVHSRTMLYKYSTPVIIPTITHAIGRDEAAVRSRPISQRLRPLVFLLFQFTMKKNSLKT